jgi:hypothetical protein
MPVAAGPDEPDDEDSQPEELTEEQRAKLRKSMDLLSSALLPINHKLQNLIGPSVTKLAADMVKLPAFTLPESALKNLTAMSGISNLAVTAQQAATNAVKPLLDAQTMWKAGPLHQFMEQQAKSATAHSKLTQPYSFINSDLFKSTALAQQSSLNAITAALTKNVDFGLGGSFAKLAQQAAGQQSTWLKNLGPLLAGFKANFYPPNLRDIEDLAFQEVEEVVMVDGVALYRVPRAIIAEALVKAEGAAKRREILGRRWKAITADCRAALEACSSEAAASYVAMALAAISALEAGHGEAAQALTGSLLDAIVKEYFGKDRYLYTANKKTRTSDAYNEFGIHEYMAFAPVWQAYQRFFVEDRDTVPYTFSRNATAHTVSVKQYSRRNAVQALMIVAGILAFLDERAAVHERRQRTAAS